MASESGGAAGCFCFCDCDLGVILKLCGWESESVREEVQLLLICALISLSCALVMVIVSRLWNCLLTSFPIYVQGVYAAVLYKFCF